MSDTHVWTATGVILGYLAGIVFALVIIDEFRFKPKTTLMIGLLIGFVVGLIVR